MAFPGICHRQAQYPVHGRHATSCRPASSAIAGRPPGAVRSHLLDYYDLGRQLDYLPVIRGERDSVRQIATLAYQDSQRAVRDSRWKLMVFPQINRHQLLDLKSDPDETQDLASSHPEQVERLMGLLRDELKSNGDTQALVVAKPKTAEFAVPAVSAYQRSKAGGGSQRQTTD